MKFQYNDGGRLEAGFKGKTGDCVTRAIAIVTGKPYLEVYNVLAEGNQLQRKTKHNTRSGRRTAAHGISAHRKWFNDYMISLGFKWVPTMFVGKGCKVHLTDGELPMGKLVVNVSKHFTAVIDGVIHDTFNPEREVHNSRPDYGGEIKAHEFRANGLINSISRRCVYGYYILKD